MRETTKPSSLFIWVLSCKQLFFPRQNYTNSDPVFLCWPYIFISKARGKHHTATRITPHTDSHTRNSLAYYGAWPSMIIWGLDRFIRLVSLAVINFGYLNPWAKKQLDAVVEVLSPHFIRVTLRRSRHFHWRPGQNAYLSFPSVSKLPFESHPFTISTIDDPTSGDSALVFLLRVKNGFTQKLLKEASSDQTYKVLLNGPYGSPPLLVGYQTVILIAGLFFLPPHLAPLSVHCSIGGSGVAFALPLFLDILRSVSSFDLLGYINCYAHPL